MKRVYMLAVSLIIANQCLHAQLLKNTGFETGDTSSWKFETPVTFGGKEPGYTCSVVKEPAAGKNFILQLASTRNSVWCQLKQGIPYQPTAPEERLRVNASVKTENMNSGNASIAIRTYGGGKDYGLVSSKSIDENTGWTTISCEVVIHEQIDSLLIFCLMTGTGKAFFDNVTIEKIALGIVNQSPQATAYSNEPLRSTYKHVLFNDSIYFNSMIQRAVKKKPAALAGGLKP